MKNVIWVLIGVLGAIAVGALILTISKNATNQVGERITDEIDGITTEYVAPSPANEELPQEFFA